MPTAPHEMIPYVLTEDEKSSLASLCKQWSLIDDFSWAYSSPATSAYIIISETAKKRDSNPKIRPPRSLSMVWICQVQQGWSATGMFGFQGQHFSAVAFTDLLAKLEAMGTPRLHDAVDLDGVGFEAQQLRAEGDIVNRARLKALSTM